MKFEHKSVLLNECIENLNIKDNGIYFDGTLGGGGHSLEIVKKLNNGRLIANDRDIEAINASKERLNDYLNKVTFVNDNYNNIKKTAQKLNISGFDGILLDLGVSSYQIDNRERGFSYMSRDSALDMRMDQSQGLTARDILNDYSIDKLEYIIKTYADEQFARNIAKNIVEYRQNKIIETTGELIDICDKSIPFKFKRDTHPAKKTFQAIRIAVNEELEGLDEGIKDMINLLNPKGRIAIITFHSLEDRIVKNVYNDMVSPCKCDKRYPCVCGLKPVIKEINKKPILPSEEEMNENSRSKSAKLRVAEKM